MRDNAAMSRTGVALRYRNFRLLWTGSFFAYAAQWIQQTTLGWVAYELTGSATVMGAILGVRAIPLLLVPPLAGVAADRFDRLRLLVGSQVLFATASFAVGIAMAVDALKVWHLFAFIVAWGTAHSIDRTMRHSMILDIVPREAVLDAIALNGIAYGVTRIAAPAAAGYLIAWFGAAGNFFIQGVGYVLFGLTVLLIRLPPATPRHEKSSAWRSLAEGLRFATTDPTTRVILFSTALPFLFLIPTWGALMPVYAKDEFKVGPEGLGWLLTAIGAGAIVGGLAASALSRIDRLGLMQVLALAVYAAALLGLAFSPSLLIALPFVAIAGVAEIMNITIGQTLMQVSAPEAMRGRLVSLMQMNPALISLGSFVAGILTDLIGVRTTSITMAISALVAGLGVTLGSSALRQLRLSHYTSPASRNPE